MDNKQATDNLRSMRSGHSYSPYNQEEEAKKIRGMRQGYSGEDQSLKKGATSDQPDEPAKPAGQFTREVKLDPGEPQKSEEKGTEESEIAQGQIAGSSVAERDYRSRAEAQAEEVIEEEEDYANQLATAQATREDQKQMERTYNLGMSFGSPSFIKWGIIIVLAMLNDIVDLLGLTGFGEIIAWFISIGLTVTILLIMWFTDSKVKAASRFLAEHGQPQIDNPGRARLASELRRKISQGPSSLTAKREEVAQQLQQKLGSSHKLNTKSLVKAMKNPIFTVLIGGGIESFPFIGDLNLITVWMLLSYIEERNGYKRARQVAKMYIT